MINKTKSAILLSPNTGDSDKRNVKDILEVEKETMNERYLGILVHVGVFKTQVFSYLKDRVWKRIQGWKEKFLSRAKKKILINAICSSHCNLCYWLF